MLKIEDHTIDELITLKNTIENYISNYEDGYFYICEVRSYGRNWIDKDIHNVHSLQDLCYNYYGDDGIVDVYSNNPYLSNIDNYGTVEFVPTIKDYDMWKDYTYLKNNIPRIEKELDEWDNRDNVQFNQRPNFSPINTREDVVYFKKELDNFDMSFVPPVSYKVSEP